MVIIDNSGNAAKKNVIVLTILLSTIGQPMRWSNEWGHSMGLMVKQPLGWWFLMTVRHRSKDAVFTYNGYSLVRGRIEMISIEPLKIRGMAG